MTTAKMTDRQRSALSRVLLGITDCLAPELALQLERRGLVMCHHWHERVEWNKVVARLRVVTLTEEGAAVAARVTLDRLVEGLVS